MSRITFTKLWPGTNCAILETIELDYAFVDAQIETSFAVGWLSFEGANVKGRAWAGSSLGLGTQHTTVEGRGEERHTYRVIAEPGCMVTDCQIRVKGTAQGQMGGVLEDSDMHVAGTGSFRILGNQFPFRFRVDPQPSPGEERGELTMDVRISPDAADVDGNVKYTWSKIVGDSDTWEGPDYEEEEIQNCNGGLVELSAHTTLTLQAYNQDWTADSCFVNAEMSCGIRTLDVTISCDCGGKEPKPRNDPVENKSKLEEQERRVSQRRSDLQYALRQINDNAEQVVRSFVENYAVDSLARIGEAIIGNHYFETLRESESKIDISAISDQLHAESSRVGRTRQRAVIAQEISLTERALGEISRGYKLNEESLALVLGRDRPLHEQGSKQ